MKLKEVQCESGVFRKKNERCVVMTPHIYLVDGEQYALCGNHRMRPWLNGEQHFHTTHAYILGHGPVLTDDGEPVITTSKYEKVAE